MNGNANDGKKRLKRIELEFKNVSYIFTINPENYDKKLQNRMNLTYTKGGAFIDLFGQGVTEISFSGTTGFTGGTEDKDHGYKKIVALQKLLEDNFKNVEDGQEITDFLNFYNHTDDEAYVTVPNKISIMRNVNQPLLYKYDLMLYAIRRVNDPKPTSDIQVTGNPLSVSETASKTIEDRKSVEESQSPVFTSSNIGTLEKTNNEDTHIVENFKVAKHGGSQGRTNNILTKD